MSTCFKGIPSAGFSFNASVKIINASLKVVMNVPTQKVKFDLYKNQLYMVNLKNFSKRRSDDPASKLTSPASSLPFCIFFLYIKYLFTLRILFLSNLIRQTAAQSAFKDTQSAVEPSRNSESTRVLGH